MFELVDNIPASPVIKVIGVGGGGGNAVNHMVKSNIEGVEFICANTDAQALKSIGARTILQLGTAVTKGLGAGANPEVGRQAALEDRERIAEVLQGTNMVFITTGMGGGTGTGAAPVVAEVARELGVLTVAVVTRPFVFEGGKRLAVSVQGVDDLKKNVDSLIVIPNQKLMEVLGDDVTMREAFRAADDVLGYASFGPWRPHDGYRHTAEHSVYVRGDQRGRGLGEALLRALITRAQSAGIHVIVGAIEAGNTGSIRLHEKLGFAHIGTMPRVGMKFGRWLDLALLQLTLDDRPNP